MPASAACTFSQKGPDLPRVDPNLPPLNLVESFAPPFPPLELAWAPLSAVPAQQPPRQHVPPGAYATDLRARPGARRPPHRPPCRPRPARIHGRPPPTLVGWRRKQVGGEMRAARLGGHGAWEFGLGAGSAALDGAAAVSTSLQHQSLARAGRRGLLAPAAPLTAWLRTPVSRSFPVGCLFSYLERGPPHGLSQAPLTMVGKAWQKGN